MRQNKNKDRTRHAIHDYDATDTVAMIDPEQPLRFEDIGLRLPEVPPTQVISIRLPSSLLNEIRSISSESDIPYHALIKLMLSRSVSRYRKTTGK